MSDTIVAVGAALQSVAFVSIAIVSLRQWHRRPSRSTGWLVVAFGGLGVVLALSAAMASQQPPMWLVRLVVGLIIVFPFALFRFACELSPVSRTVRNIGTGMLAALLLATAFVPDPGERRPWWLAAYLYLFMGTWTYLTVVSASKLWRGGRGHPTIVRRRVRMLALGQMLVNFAVLGGQIGEGNDVKFVTNAMALTSALMFLLGFVLPRWVRTVWRRSEVDAFRDAEVALMATNEKDEVAGVILPHATRLVGGSSAVLADRSGAVIASENLEGRAATALVAHAMRTSTGGEVLTRDFAAISMQHGWLVVRTSPYTPVFGRDELSLLRSLAHLADLALARAQLFAAEREALRQVSVREAQLAEAQHLAKIGSYEWDIVNSTTVWSREMYVLYGYPFGYTPEPEDFLARVHPDDRDRLVAISDNTIHHPGDLSIEFRITHPTGGERWMHGLGRAVREADGSVRRIVGTVRDITEQKRVEAELAHLALHDALTGLPNRLLLIDRLNQSLARASRTHRPLGLLFLDVDRFKVVNDGLGHSIGDELLRAIAERIQKLLRPTDTVARLGGDEFVVLIDDLVDDQEAIEVTRRISDAIKAPLAVSGDREVSVTASVGIVIAGSERTDAEALLRDADSAMYRAKELGRSRFELFDSELRAQLLERIDTERSLGTAIDRGEFTLVYQADVELVSGRIVGMEALLRWMHPERGMLSPCSFVSLAEETGHIVAIGQWVLHEACKQAKQWIDTGVADDDFVVWVNLSARQFRDADVTATVRLALLTSGLAPVNLGLEITESVFMDNTERVGETFRELKAMGVRLAIDDFGTGFSSLGYLKRFPVDVLKIDRSFVNGLGADREDEVLVGACVTLAHALGMSAIAEGVETDSQIDQLRLLGCDHVQGFLLARPATAECAAVLLQRSQLLEPARPRILVCDDDAHVRDVYEAALLAEGADVMTAASGDECVLIAQTFRPDLIVLDLVMPVHDGLWTLSQLQGRTKARVVLVTAAASRESVEKALALGAEAYLDKIDFLTRLPSLLHVATAA